MIPEATNDGDAGLLALYAAGRGAIGFSPFAIESMTDAAAAALTRSYTMLGGLAPLLTVATPAQRAGVLLDKQSPTTKTHGGRQRADRRHTTTRSRGRRRHATIRHGRAAAAWCWRSARTNTSSRATASSSRSAADRRASNASTRDATKTASGSPIRRLNGDETHQGRQVRL